VDDDITNLFKSTDLGTLFLDAGLKIKRFTSTAAQIFNLVETDKGRPISDITHKLRYDRFGQDLQEVLDDLSKKEMDVQTRTGEWLTIRIRPYRTSQDVIDGVIVTFTEVTSLKNAEIEARQAHRTMEGIMDTIRQPLVVLDGDLILRFANDAFFKRFSLLPEKALLHRFTDLLERRWDVEALKENIKKMASADGVSEIKFPGVPAGERGEILLGRCVERDGDEPKLILLTFEEKCAEE
jgi:two-component system CheB/CheR fusion protein